MKNFFLILTSFILIGCAGKPVKDTTLNNEPVPTIDISLNDKFETYKCNKITVMRISNIVYTKDFFIDAINGEFLKLGFNVIERQHLEELLKEQHLSLTGIIETGQYDKIGKIAELDAIVFINTDVYAGNHIETVSLKMVDIATGTILLTLTYHQGLLLPYKKQDSFDQVIKRIGKELKEKLKIK